MTQSSRMAGSALVVAIVATGPSQAQKFVERIDGVYMFAAAPHTGTLAVKDIKSGLLFEVTTVSPKGATCEARGQSAGGKVSTFRAGEAGFRLTVGRGQITISGLLGRVSEQPFCGLGAMLTGVYNRSGPLDAKTAAALKDLKTPLAKSR